MYFYEGMGIIDYLKFAYAAFVCRSLESLTKRLRQSISFYFNEGNSMFQFKARINNYARCNLSYIFARIQTISLNINFRAFCNRDIVINVVELPFSLDGTPRLYDWYVDRNVLYISKIGIGGGRYSGLVKGVEAVLTGVCG